MKLSKAENKQAFLKGGCLGFPGSGKTYTMSLLAMSIAKKLGGEKPVAFFDTESGSDFLIPHFKKAGIELLTAKSQAFKDLLDVAREAEKVASVLIVDSISHVWRELCETYRKKKGVTRLQFQHWGDIKNQWHEWTTFYLNSKLHILVLGRAGYEYDFEEQDGKKELIKTGTKMKVESEFGFEPSLLIEMERVSKGSEPGSGWIHRAHILKDRTDSINGKAFDFHADAKGRDATFKAFEPVLKALNIGGDHVGVVDSDSSSLFNDQGESRGVQRAKLVTIALEEIQGTLVKIWPGMDVPSKKAKALVIETLFGTKSWTAVEGKSLETLQHAVKVLAAFEKLAAVGGFDSEQDMIAALISCSEKIEAEALEKDKDSIDNDNLPDSFEPKIINI